MPSPKDVLSTGEAGDTKTPNHRPLATPNFFALSIALFASALGTRSFQTVTACPVPNDHEAAKRRELKTLVMACCQSLGHKKCLM